MTEWTDYFSDKMSKMSEAERKLSRRRKKQPHGPSSLLRATIQEYGIYDKEVDAYKTQFVRVFDFLDSWKRSPGGSSDNNNSIPPDKTRDNGHNGRASSDPVANNSGVGSGRLNGNLQLQLLDGAPIKPYGRDLSLEEELEFRLQRMTNIAADFKLASGKERERRNLLLNEVTDCKEQCLQLLDDMTAHFHRETELLQHRLLEMDSTIDELEHEKHSMKLAYEDMVHHANKTVEAMGRDLLKAETRAKGHEEDLMRLRASYSSVEEENSVFRDEADELHATIKELRLKVETLENQLHAADLSREHYESLLDISLDKLRLLEYGEVPPRRNLLKLRQRRALLQLSTGRTASSSSSSGTAPCSAPASGSYSGPTLTPPVLFPRRSKSDETPCVKHLEVSTIPKPRLSSDSQSMTSYETGSETSSGAVDTCRLTSDDRASLASTLSRTPTIGSTVSGAPSPKTAARKKAKKKTFFAKAFQRKTQAVSGTTPPTGTAEGGSTTGGTGPPGFPDGLPTIRDEHGETRGSQSSLTGLAAGDAEGSAIIKSFDAGLLAPRSDFGPEQPDGLLQRGRCHSVDDLDHYTFMSDTCTKGPDEERDTKRTKKVQRTTSFAAIRKNGLTAFAKEVEKRFRKKRRSKTADCTEILQAKEEYERSQKTGFGGKDS